MDQSTVDGGSGPVASRAVESVARRWIIDTDGSSECGAVELTSLATRQLVEWRREQTAAVDCCSRADESGDGGGGGSVDRARRWRRWWQWIRRQQTAAVACCSRADEYGDSGDWPRLATGGGGGSVDSRRRQWHCCSRADESGDGGGGGSVDRAERWRRWRRWICRQQTAAVGLSTADSGRALVHRADESGISVTTDSSGDGGGGGSVDSRRRQWPVAVELTSLATVAAVDPSTEPRWRRRWQWMLRQQTAAVALLQSS